MNMDDTLAALVAEHTRELQQKLAESLRTEKALREDENRYRSLVENSPDAIGISQEGRLVFVNSAAVRQFGAKTKEEMIGRKTEEIIHPADLPGALMHVRKRQEGEESIHPVEVRYLRLDGTTLPAEVIATVITFRDKAAVQFVARDITERKRAEEQIRKLSRAVEQSPASIVITDLAGRIEYVNPKFTQLTGYTFEEVRGQNPRVLKGDETPAEEYRRLWQTISRGDEWRGEFHNRKKDGGRYWELASISPVVDAEGRVTHYLAVKEDITDRKALEEQLRQAQKLDSIGRLAGGVAHDFNNMVQVILGNVDLALEKTPPGSTVHESLEEIRKAARRSADLTEQLLAFARKQTIAPSLVDLNTTVETLLTLLRRLIGGEVHLAWLPASDLGPVKVDPTQVHQVLANLCLNARDAIGDAGKITIQSGKAIFDEAYCAHHPTVTPGEYVSLSVSDEGCGMDKETLAHLFEPFFTTKGVGKGTGLGLATVYGIVEQNHGFIQVESEPAQGTVVRIYLPQHVDQPPATRPKAVPEVPKSRGELVLLVEDRPAIVAVVRRGLERLGYRVLTGSTPSEAIRIAETHASEIHLLLTNVVMPEMNGRDLARRLLPLCPEIKCLFMSGYPSDVIAQHGVTDKGMHFIAKPFAVAELAAKVREALEAGRGQL